MKHVKNVNKILYFRRVIYLLCIQFRITLSLKFTCIYNSVQLIKFMEWCHLIYAWDLNKFCRHSQYLKLFLNDFISLRYYKFLYLIIKFSPFWSSKFTYHNYIMRFFKTFGLITEIKINFSVLIIFYILFFVLKRYL